MTIANIMSLISNEMGFLILEVSIILLLLYLIYLGRIIKRSMEKRYLLGDSHPIWKSFQEVEAICQNLSRNLEERKEIAKQLIIQMDERIERLHSMIEKIDEAEHFLSKGGKGKDLEGRILGMAETGCDVSDIARELQKSKGEIQLTLDLEKFRQSL